MNKNSIVYKAQLSGQIAIRQITPQGKIKLDRLCILTRSAVSLKNLQMKNFTVPEISIKTNLKFVDQKFEKCGKIKARTEEVVNPIQQSATFPTAFKKKIRKRTKVSTAGKGASSSCSVAHKFSRCDALCAAQQRKIKAASATKRVPIASEVPLFLSRAAFQLHYVSFTGCISSTCSLI